MAFYTVHLPPEAGTPDEVAEKAVFVKEGFAFFGLAFGGLWLLVNRLWLPAIAYACALAVVWLAFHFLPLPPQAYGFVTLLMGLLVGLEGREWLRRSYANKGWIQAGTVSGASLAECERRFFRTWLEEQASVQPMQPATAIQDSAIPRSTYPQAVSHPVLGVFPTVRDRS